MPTHLDIPPFASRVVPVITITSVAQAVPLAQALLDGGIDIMEITLRHEAGLDAITAVARSVPQMLVAAGTVTHPQEFARVRSAGARLALSPGFTPELLAAASHSGLPFIPGVMTPGEVMVARGHGFQLLKLFPASQAGGVAMLRSLAGPLGDVRFCPTGGVTQDSLGEFLAQPNVAMVGGTWLTPPALLEQGRWAEITRLARAACDAAREAGQDRPA